MSNNPINRTDLQKVAGANDKQYTATAGEKVEAAPAVSVEKGKLTGVNAGTLGAPRFGRSEKPD